jgi:hypothetical protein
MRFEECHQEKESKKLHFLFTGFNFWEKTNLFMKRGLWKIDIRDFRVKTIWTKKKKGGDGGGIKLQLKRIETRTAHISNDPQAHKQRWTLPPPRDRMPHARWQGGREYQAAEGANDFPAY